MRNWVAVVGLVVLLGGGYLLYRTEAIHSLLQAPSDRKGDPLDFLDEVQSGETNSVDTGTKPPDPARDSPNQRPTQRNVQPARSPSPAESAPAGPPEVPNAQVSRVLLGILKARGLAYGISLSVTDRELRVDGEVDSEEKRLQIIEVVNKGRGNRVLNADHLVVIPPE